MLKIEKGIISDMHKKKLSIWNILDLEWNLLSKWNIFCQRDCSIVILFEVIHPYFGCSAGVSCKDIPRTPWKRVGMLLPENMSNAAAWNDFQATSTLPDTKRNLCYIQKHIMHFWIRSVVFLFKALWDIDRQSQGYH